MLGSAAFIFARNPTQWVASLLGNCFSAVMADTIYLSRSRTFSQKLVQCRMVAQGATVAVLIASAGLSRFQPEGEEQNGVKPEEQWRQMVSQSVGKVLGNPSS